MQEWRTDPAQSHQRRRAEFRPFGRSLGVRERIIGEVALQIEGVKDPALGTTRVAIAILVLGAIVAFMRGPRSQAGDGHHVARQSICRLALPINDGHMVEEKVREDRRPHVGEMLRPYISRRLTGLADRYMAADTVQLAIGLIDRIVVAPVTPGLHRAADSAVGKRHQVDAEQLRPTLDHGSLAVGVQGLPRVARLQHIEQRVPELGRSGVAQQVSDAEGCGEVDLERVEVDWPRWRERRRWQHTYWLTERLRKRHRTRQRLYGLRRPSRKQSGKSNFSAVE